MAYPRLFHTPLWLQWAFPDLTWRKQNIDNAIYLTFDDGPCPEVTPWLLETLQAYQASATCFCVGANAQKYPELLKAIKRDGHQLGNHTYRHKDGWRTSTQNYLADVHEADQYLSTALFRPPYGKITPRIANALKGKGYQVIMWDVLSYDFDKRVDTAKALNKCLRHTKPGSIIVFHDLPKAFPQLKALLPAFLNQIYERGYHFALL